MHIRFAITVVDERKYEKYQGRFWRISRKIPKVITILIKFLSFPGRYLKIKDKNNTTWILFSTWNVLQELFFHVSKTRQRSLATCMGFVSDTYQRWLSIVTVSLSILFYLPIVFLQCICSHVVFWKFTFK